MDSQDIRAAICITKRKRDRNLAAHGIVVRLELQHLDDLR
jgi:hypothetical protein